MKRLFLAIPVPPVIPALEEELRLLNPALSEIKWMRPYNLHLTFYFIGNTDEADYGRIVSTCTTIFATQTRFELLPEKVALAPADKPRMIWARYQRHAAFTALAGRLQEALSPFVPGPKAHFPDPVPHITIARFHAKPQIYERIQLADTFLPLIPVAHCELWETIQVGGRSDYKSAQVFEFQ